MGRDNRLKTSFWAKVVRYQQQLNLIFKNRQQPWLSVSVLWAKIKKCVIFRLLKSTFKKIISKQNFIFSFILKLTLFLMYCKMYAKKKFFWVEKISLLRSVQKNFKKRGDFSPWVQYDNFSQITLFSNFRAQYALSRTLSHPLFFFLLIGWLSGNSGNGASAS